MITFESDLDIGTMETFTRQVDEMGGKVVAWLVHPLQLLMSMFYMRSDIRPYFVIDAGILSDHHQKHIVQHDDMPLDALTIPPIQVEMTTPEGKRAFLVDGNNRVNILAQRGVQRIPVFHVREEVANLFRFTDEEAAILHQVVDTPAIAQAKHSILSEKVASLKEFYLAAEQKLRESPYTTYPFPRPLQGLVIPEDMERFHQEQASPTLPPLSTERLEDLQRQAGLVRVMLAPPQPPTPATQPRKVPAWEAAKARKKAKKKKR